MDNIGRVYVQTSSKKLVHEVLTMIVGEVLSGVYDSVHVGLHQLRDDIDVFKARTLRGLLDIN